MKYLFLAALSAAFLCGLNAQECTPMAGQYCAPLSSKRPPCFRIPVVFHVIHDVNDDIGDETNPSDEAFLALIDQFNKDFRGTNEDLSEVIIEMCSRVGDASTQFYLADEIHRVPHDYHNVPIPHGNDSPDFLAGDIQRLSPKSPETQNYLHIWTVRFRGSHSVAEGSLGEECPLIPYPSPYDKFECATDGIIVSVGSITNTSRTPTHELGHWLGLTHLHFSPFDLNRSSRDDQIRDTPRPSGGTCNDLYSLASNNLQTSDYSCFDNHQNFMELPDVNAPACRRMFTKGQVAKMWSTMYDHRPQYLTKTYKECLTQSQPTEEEDVIIAAPLDDPGSLGTISRKNLYWPNPTSGLLSFNDGQVASVVLWGLDGKRKISKVVGTGESVKSINLSTLPSGIYFVSLVLNDGTTSSHRIVKQ